MYNTEGPNTHGIDFHISTSDTTEIVHKRKRHLQGTLRDEIVKEIRAKTTRKWRLEYANQHMDMGDVEPANLYSSIVLRKAKQQKINDELGTGPSKNPALEVVNLKSNPEFAGSIHEACYSKFYAMYWTPEQIELYKKFMNESAGIICIDATGSIIKPVSTFDGSRSIVFLYQAVAIFNGKTLRIFQMISETHDANTLQYWIGEWLRSKIKPPKQVVTDFSLAFLNACSVAFNQNSLKKYLKICYEQAVLSNNAENLTILRIDIAHLLHFISRWPVFNKNFPQIKEFFLKCKTRKHLMNILKNGYNIIGPSQDIFADLTELNDYDQIDMPNNIEQFLSNIIEKSSCDNSGNFPKLYFCPDFAKRFLKLSSYFLLWTGIMLNPKSWNKCEWRLQQDMKHILRR